MKKMISLAVLLLFAGSANTETYKTMIISMPLRAELLKPLLKCDWSKEFPSDMVCEVYLPASADKAEAIMALRPTVWTEAEWKKLLEDVQVQTGREKGKR